MEPNYEKLDTLLKKISNCTGASLWINNKEYNQREFWALGNQLASLGLVNCIYNGNHGNTYEITLKGLQVVGLGKSTKEIIEEQLKEEELKVKILEGTIESYKTSKKATRLNQYQLAVTITLGFVSALTIYFQWQANITSQKNLEISEKAYHLELDNKAKIDTIFVKMNTQKPLK